MSNRCFAGFVLCASLLLAASAVRAAAAVEQAVATLFSRPVPSVGPRDAAAFEAMRTLRLAGSEGADALKRAIAALPEDPDEADSFSIFRRVVVR